MLPQSTIKALRTEELMLQFDRAEPRAAEDDKMSVHDLFATVGQVASVVGACGLLNVLF